MERRQAAPLPLTEKQYTLLDLLTIPFRCSFWAAGFIAVQHLLIGLVPTLQVLAAAKFIDGAIQVYQGKLALAQIYSSLVAIVVLLTYSQLVNGIMSFATTKLKMGLAAKFRTSIISKRAKLEYQHIENSETWDLMTRVAADGESQVVRGFFNLLDMGSSVIRVFGLFLLLFTQAWWAALIILFFAVPLFIVGIKSGQATYEVSRAVSKLKRRNEYLSEVLLSRELVEERALFGYGTKVNSRWHKLFEEARLAEHEVGKKWYLRMKSGSLITTLTSVFIVVVLLNPVLTGALSVGMFISLINAVFGLVEMMSWQFVHNMDQLARSREYLKDLSKFTSLSEADDPHALPLESRPEFRSLEFKEVSFAYPGTDKLILDRLSFRIEAGQHYAFVGINGAGKTTIIKLITGLYTEYSGEILINERDLRTHSQQELKSLINVLYQDFARYYISLGENIALGNTLRQYDKSAISDIAARLELSDVIARLPQGLQTPLGKIKSDGQDLSGGEWQRVAMARAVYNPAPLRILDEPTAALDPLAESHLYQQFEAISRDKTTIFISHRLGSTKLADHIFVIGEGRLQESGTHAELIDKQGLYHEMYLSQRGWYS